MRWGHNLNATWPFARLGLQRHGITAGPTLALLGGYVPTLEHRWEDLTLIEPVRWPFVPFIADGVRFLASDSVSSHTGFIFWSGSGWRTKRILDFCESAAPGLVSRDKRLAPVLGI
jgi:hypothetical protein